MKKLLQINSVYNEGSTGRIVALIHDLAKRNGWDSYVAYGRGKKQNDTELFFFGNKIEFIFHLIKTRLWDSHGLGSDYSTKKLIRYIDNLQPDVIHFHNLHGYYVNVELLLNYLNTSKIKIIWTLHDCWLFTGHCAYYTNINCLKWKTECNNCEKKNDYPKSLFKDNSKRNFNLKYKLFTKLNSPTLVAVSEWLRCELSMSFLGSFTSKTIYNGVDCNLYSPSIDSSNKLGLPVDKKIVLGVSFPFNERKGLFYFNKLAEIIGDDIVIVLVGIEKSQLSKLHPKIIPRGRTKNPEELARYYSRANIFLNMSIEDNFPTTNIEALSCGTPVVTFDTGGCKEAIDNNTGIVVAKGDVKKVLGSINHILLNPELFSPVNCRSRAIEKFNFEFNYLEYLKVYNEQFNY
jgi:putative colanic acid biosynthesis glycosyltransferase